MQSPRTQRRSQRHLSLQERARTARPLHTRSPRVTKFQPAKHQFRMLRISTPRITQLQAMSEEVTGDEIIRQGITKRQRQRAKWKQATNLLAARVRSPRNGTSRFRPANRRMSNPGREIPKKLM